MNDIDLLTVLMHEIGHLLGYQHTDSGLMDDTLAAGVRGALSQGGDADTTRAAADAFFALLTADEETAWIGSSLFGRRRPKR